MTDETTDQAQEQSVEDRIYAKFENPENQEAAQEATQEAEAGSEEQAEEYAEVEYDGERFQVPKKLEKAILQEADYTRKTQEIANQRKLLEQAQSSVSLATMEREFQSSVAEELHNIRTMDNYIKSLKSQNFNDMTAEDGFRQWMLINQASEQRDALSKSVEAKREDFKANFHKAISEAKAKSHELLAKQINGYSPDAFAEARKYGEKVGFPADVLDSIESDPRAAALLFKAMRFDQLQANKVQSVKKLDAPVVKPGASRPMPQDVKDKLNYRKAINSAKTRAERNAVVQRRVEAMF